MKPTLIYDGDCSFCRRAAERVRKLDTLNRIDYLPRQSIPDGRFTAADRARFAEAIHFLDTDGVLTYGGHVIPHVMRYLPRWKRWAWFFHLSGVLWIASRVYKAIARKRHRLGNVCPARRHAPTL